jgi:hypothetical protein
MVREPVTGVAFTTAIGVLVRMREKGLLTVGEALVKLATLGKPPGGCCDTMPALPANPHSLSGIQTTRSVTVS